MLGEIPGQSSVKVNIYKGNEGLEGANGEDAEAPKETGDEDAAKAAETPNGADNEGGDDKPTPRDDTAASRGILGAFTEAVVAAAGNLAGIGTGITVTDSAADRVLDIARIHFITHQHRDAQEYGPPPHLRPPFCNPTAGSNKRELHFTRRFVRKGQGSR